MADALSDDASLLAQWRRQFLDFNAGKSAAPQRPQRKFPIDSDFDKASRIYNRALVSAAETIIRENNPENADEYLASYREFFGGVDENGAIVYGKLDTNRDGMIDGKDGKITISAAEVESYTRAVALRIAMDRVVGRLNEGKQWVSAEESTIVLAQGEKYLDDKFDGRVADTWQAVTQKPREISDGGFEVDARFARTIKYSERASDSNGGVEKPERFTPIPSPRLGQTSTYGVDLFRLYKKQIIAYQKGEIADFPQPPEADANPEALVIYERAMLSVAQEMVDADNPQTSQQRLRYRQYYGGVSNSDGALISADRSGKLQWGWQARRLDSNRDGMIDGKDTFDVAAEDVDAVIDAIAYARAVERTRAALQLGRRGASVPSLATENEIVRKEFAKEHKPLWPFSKKTYRDGGYDIDGDALGKSSLQSSKEGDTIKLPSITEEQLKRANGALAFEEVLAKLPPETQSKVTALLATDERFRGLENGKLKYALALAGLEEQARIEAAAMSGRLGKKESADNVYYLALQVTVRREQYDENFRTKKPVTSISNDEERNNFRRDVLEKVPEYIRQTTAIGLTQTPELISQKAFDEITSLPAQNIYDHEKGDSRHRDREKATNAAVQARDAFKGKVRALLQTVVIDSDQDRSIDPQNDPSYSRARIALRDALFSQLEGKTKDEQNILKLEYLAAMVVLSRQQELRAQQYAQENNLSPREVEVLVDENGKPSALLIAPYFKKQREAALKEAAQPGVAVTVDSEVTREDTAVATTPVRVVPVTEEPLDDIPKPAAQPPAETAAAQKGITFDFSSAKVLYPKGTPNGIDDVKVTIDGKELKDAVINWRIKNGAFEYYLSGNEAALGTKDERILNQAETRMMFAAMRAQQPELAKKLEDAENAASVSGIELTDKSQFKREKGKENQDKIYPVRATIKGKDWDGTLIAVRDGRGEITRYEFAYHDLGQRKAVPVSKERFEAQKDAVIKAQQAAAQAPASPTPAAEPAVVTPTINYEVDASQASILTRSPVTKVATVIVNVGIVIDGKKQTGSLFRTEIPNAPDRYEFVIYDGGVDRDPTRVDLGEEQGLLVFQKVLQEKAPQEVERLNAAENQFILTREKLNIQRAKVSEQKESDNIKITGVTATFADGKQVQGTLYKIQEGIVPEPYYRYEFRPKDKKLEKIAVDAAAFEAIVAEIKSPATVAKEEKPEPATPATETTPPVATRPAESSAATSEKPKEKTPIPLPTDPRVEAAAAPKAAKPKPILSGFEYEKAARKKSINGEPSEISGVTVTITRGDKSETKTGRLVRKKSGDVVFIYGMPWSETQITLHPNDNGRFDEATAAVKEKEAKAEEAKAKQETAKPPENKPQEPATATPARPAPTSAAKPVAAEPAPAMRAREDEALLDYILGKDGEKGKLLWYQAQTVDRGLEARIKDMQESLVRAGNYAPPPEPNGKFGRKTEDAVRAIQQEFNIKQDGILGVRTVMALQVKEAENLVEALQKDGLTNAEKQEITKELADITRVAGALGDKVPAEVRKRIDGLVASLEASGVKETDAALQQQLASLRSVTESKNR